MKTHSMRILIVGCGNLGGRHLQAVYSLPQIKEIEIVDSRPEALDAVRDLLLEVPQRQFDISFRLATLLREATSGGDLCIVATQATGRCELILQIHETLGYKTFLVEKIVSQSVADYERLLDYAKRHKLSIWVNCKSRAHPSHRRVKQSLMSEEPILFHVSGGNHGLANNGIHIADLFCFFDGCKKIQSGGHYIDPVLHPSKRGKNIFDLSGTLLGYSEKKSQLTLSFSAAHDGPTHFTILTRSYRAIIDDYMKWFYESKEKSGWIWEKVPYEANLMVSNMTKTFANDILNTGKCELPTLEECFPAHQFILGELQPHFKKLVNPNIDCCPVT